MNFRVLIDYGRSCFFCCRGVLETFDYDLIMVTVLMCLAVSRALPGHGIVRNRMHSFPYSGITVSFRASSYSGFTLITILRPCVALNGAKIPRSVDANQLNYP